jgi:hypothetical protein
MRLKMTNSPRSTFTLNGRSISLDERVHAVRGDLADLALAGQIFVPHYARPMAKTCVEAGPMLRKSPSEDSEATSQLLLGETFMVIDETGGWAWGYCRHDHYVGYVPASALAPMQEGADDAAITVREAQLFALPDEAADRTGSLPMGARVRAAPQGDFVETPLGYVKAEALAAPSGDAVDIALSLLDVPYVWGGRSAHGIDCSGLIQLALGLTGTAIPRDTDQQQDVVGTELADNDALLRGDLVYFPGHVGMMADAETLIHATMHYEKLVAEPLADVIARFAAEHPIPVLARRRPAA